MSHHTPHSYDTSLHRRHSSMPYLHQTTSSSSSYRSCSYSRDSYCNEPKPYYHNLRQQAHLSPLNLATHAHHSHHQQTASFSSPYRSSLHSPSYTQHSPSYTQHSPSYTQHSPSYTKHSSFVTPASPAYSTNSSDQTSPTCSQVPYNYSGYYSTQSYPGSSSYDYPRPYTSDYHHRKVIYVCFVTFHN